MKEISSFTAEVNTGAKVRSGSSGFGHLDAKRLFKPTVRSVYLLWNIHGVKSRRIIGEKQQQQKRTEKFKENIICWDYSGQLCEKPLFRAFRNVPTNGGCIL